MTYLNTDKVIERRTDGHYIIQARFVPEPGRWFDYRDLPKGAILIDLERALAEVSDGVPEDQMEWRGIYRHVETTDVLEIP